MDYLVQQNRCVASGEPESSERIHARGKRVMIIGGGDTGADCLGTCLRQKAESMAQLEIMPKPPPTRDKSTPWPMWPYRLRTSSSHEEGGTRQWSVLTKEFLGTDSVLSGMRGVSVKWENSVDGRMVFQEIPDSGFEDSVDLVLLAMGFTGDGNAKVLSEFGIKTDLKGMAILDEKKMSSVSGIFVAGDLSKGASLVVRAIADGRAAAEGMNSSLSEHQ